MPELAGLDNVYQPEKGRGCEVARLVPVPLIRLSMRAGMHAQMTNPIMSVATK